MPTFNKDAVTRIQRAIPWAEAQIEKGFSVGEPEDVETGETIYAILTEKDPGGQAGYWKVEEAIYDTDRFKLLDGGRKWDDVEQSYVRHYNWGSAEIGQAVKLYTVPNEDTGEDWVFDTDVTNPEGFVFYADDNGNAGQARKDSTWTMKNGGKVLTNVGEATIAAPFTLTTGQSAQVVMTFVDYGYGFQLMSANLTTGEGSYWSESDGTIIVKWRIAKIEAVGDMSRLIQYHSGDLHLEITEPANVLGSSYINVNKNGKTFTIEHILPNPLVTRYIMKGLSAAFPCDEVSFSSVKDVQNWVNEVFLPRLVQGKWEGPLGHMIALDPCYGKGEDNYDPIIDYEQLTSTLTTSPVGSNIKPQDINGSGIDLSYTILNQGKNYTGFIATKSVIIGMANDDGLMIPYSIVAGGVKLGAVPTLAQNVGGTSGLALSEVYLGVDKFKFNSTIDITANIIGKALLKTEQEVTAPCLVTVTTNETVIRSFDDPNAAPFTLKVAFDVADLGTSTDTPRLNTGNDSGSYVCEVSFLHPDDSFVGWSEVGSAGPFNEGPINLELNATSDTGTFDNIWFDIDDDTDPGDVIKLCVKLLTRVTEFNANAFVCEFLSFSNDGDCIVDESGNAVTDDEDDCITDVSTAGDLNPASCSYPGIQTDAGASQVNAFGSRVSSNAFASIRADLEDSTYSTTAGGGSSKILNNLLGATEVGRYALNYDTSAWAGDINMRLTTTGTNTSWNYKIYYKTGALPAVTNQIYDITSAWTLLGRANLPANPSTTNHDLLASSLPKNASLWIAVVAEPDANNDFTSVTGIDVTGGAGNAFVETGCTLYEC